MRRFHSLGPSRPRSTHAGDERIPPDFGRPVSSVPVVCARACGPRLDWLATHVVCCAREGWVRLACCALVVKSYYLRALEFA